MHDCTRISPSTMPGGPLPKVGNELYSLLCKKHQTDNIRDGGKESLNALAGLETGIHSIPGERRAVCVGGQNISGGGINIAVALKLVQNGIHQPGQLAFLQ